MKRVLAVFLAGVFATSVAALAQQTAGSGSSVTQTSASSTSTDLAVEVQQLKSMLQQQQQEIEHLRQQVATQQSVQGAGPHTAQVENAAWYPAGNTTVASGEPQTSNTTGSTDTPAKKEGESPFAIHFKGITITPGGFLAAETVWRQRGLAADVNTPFTSVPFAGSSNSHISEFFGSGRQSRISMMGEGKVGVAKLTGYFETDWLSAGVTSNNNQSNSYTNRQRQLWGQVALPGGVQITGGQQWSLVAETRKGLDNRTEALPMTIDAQYVPGFSWARQFGVRFTKNFDNKVWLGFSVENPQTTFTAHGQANNFVIGAPGTGGGLFNPTANYSFNKIPDLIAKIAFEPGWGHYEIFGIFSQFRDRVYPGAILATPSTAGAFNDTVTGGGVGVNARGSLANKHVDIGVHFLAGNGMGRYGTTGLSDATVHPDGTLALIRSYQALGTLEYHAKKFDWYANVGGEYAGRAAFLNAAGKPVGYGSPLFVNTGCMLEGAPGAGGFVPGAPSNCTGDTRNIIEGTTGFYIKFYNGTYGRIQWGPQYAYVVRNTWTGVGGSPNGIDNMVFTSFRYYLP